MKKIFVFVALLIVIVALSWIYYFANSAKAGRRLFCTKCVCPGDTQYRSYYCDSSSPYFSYCDCKCYSSKNYDTTRPGGCNTWADCK